MRKNNLAEYKKKYQNFRHHAWAGLGFLSVTLAIRVIFPEIDDRIMIPIILLLIIYILIALIFTYKYRSGLASKEEIIKLSPSVTIEKEKIKTEVGKECLKLEKKKAKSKAKVRKKAKK